MRDTLIKFKNKQQGVLILTHSVVIDVLINSIS